MLSEHKARKKQMLFAAGILLTALIGGGNYVTGLECGIWLATAVLLLVLSETRGMEEDSSVSWRMGTFDLESMRPHREIL